MADSERDYQRKFLVVVDDSKETDRAMNFAVHRVMRTGGTVVLLAVIETQDFTGFFGVEEVMRAEARENAERLLDARLARISQWGDVRTETVIREGELLSVIGELVASDPGIGILVLAAANSKDGPGQLITDFAARAGNAALPIIVTIVPGTLTDEQIIAVS